MNKLCECGCGKEVTPTVYRSKIKIYRFIRGHNSRMKDHGEKCRLAHQLTKILETVNKLCKCGCGKELINKRMTFISGHNPSNFLGKRVSEEHKQKLRDNRLGKKNSAETRSRISNSNIGKKHTPETLQKMRGQKRSEETRLKISNSLIGHSVSSESKVKMSISTIKRIEKQSFDGGQMYPRIGINEIFILNQIEKAIGLEIDKNSRKLASISGKFNDGFIHKYNLGLDVLEDWHFKFTGELRDYDQDREIIIAWKLSCMIYYIPEQEFLKNPEKEIQRFKDFLLLLDQGRN